ncbi:hypothetical protein Q5752_002543 [Cryptotrichosporon argae]
MSFPSGFTATFPSGFTGFPPFPSSTAFPRPSATGSGASRKAPSAGSTYESIIIALVSGCVVALGLGALAWTRHRRRRRLEAAAARGAGRAGRGGRGEKEGERPGWFEVWLDGAHAQGEHIADWHPITVRAQDEKVVVTVLVAMPDPSGKGDGASLDEQDDDEMGPHELGTARLALLGEVGAVQALREVG